MLVRDPLCEYDESKLDHGYVLLVSAGRFIWLCHVSWHSGLLDSFWCHWVLGMCGSKRKRIHFFMLSIYFWCMTEVLIATVFRKGQISGQCFLYAGMKLCALWETALRGFSLRATMCRAVWIWPRKWGLSLGSCMFWTPAPLWLGPSSLLSECPNISSTPRMCSDR